MARIETHGLRRSVGVGGLFATAYGNVGSSIYYALGLVAAYALGLTPVVFMLAGGLFALTAKTYAEGAVDVSRGRRLLELRPPRVQRARLVHRRLGAEPRLHPHDRDLGVLRAALPGRVLAGADAPARGRDRRDHRDRAAGLAEHPRDRRVGEPEPDPRGARPRHPGADHLHRRGARAEPVAARPPGRSRHDADVLAPDLRAVARDARLHGDRDRLEHGRGGGRPGPGRAARRSTTS